MRDEINARLDQLLPAVDRPPARLHEAMRYALLGSGKRIRPILCVLVSETAGGVGRSFAVDAGCAVEMVHSASLILDDLPSMDNARLRRGRAATHLEFGEATAILAAIGLLNRAYGAVAEHTAAGPAHRTAVLDVLSQAIGSDGMIAGQEIDLNQRAAFNGTAPIEQLNWLKTGVLFVAAAHIGGLCAQLQPTEIEAVKDFAKHVGLAFQTADDLIDQTGDVKTSGKDIGQDDGVPSIVTLSGRRAACCSCEDHLNKAVTALKRSNLDSYHFTALIEGIFGS